MIKNGFLSFFFRLICEMDATENSIRGACLMNMYHTFLLDNAIFILLCIEHSDWMRVYYSGMVDEQKLTNDCTGHIYT